MSGVFQNIDPQPPHTLAGWSGGWEVNILEDARHSSVLYICKYFVLIPIIVHESMLYLLYAAGTKNNEHKQKSSSIQEPKLCVMPRRRLSAGNGGDMDQITIKP